MEASRIIVSDRARTAGIVKRIPVAPEHRRSNASTALEQGLVEDNPALVLGTKRKHGQTRRKDRTLHSQGLRPSA